VPEGIGLRCETGCDIGFDATVLSFFSRDSFEKAQRKLLGADSRGLDSGILERQTDRRCVCEKFLVHQNISLTFSLTIGIHCIQYSSFDGFRNLSF
jgi:hypothetical protein